MDFEQEMEQVKNWLKSGDDHALTALYRMRERMPRHAYIVEQVYGIGCNSIAQVAIAQNIGISPNRVWQLRNRALRDLRRYIYHGIDFNSVPWPEGQNEPAH